MYVYTHRICKFRKYNFSEKKGTNKPKPQTVAKLLCQIDSDTGNSNPGLLHVVSFISGSR